MSQNMVRMTFTVPPELREDLAYLSGRLGVTRSAFVSLLLGDTVRDMRQLLEHVPERPTEEDFKRFRGESVAIVESRMASLRRMGDDLFPPNRG